MIKKCMLAIMIVALVAPLYSQEKGKAKKAAETGESVAAEKKQDAQKPKVTVWQEVMLEDFETTPYTDKNITFNKTADQEAKLNIRDQLPATGMSKKYLGIKVKSRGGDIFIIKPVKDMILDKYCKSISFWVYGKRSLGELSFMIQDTKQENHKIIIVPTIDFSGWKKFTVVMSNKIAQQDDFLNQKKTMKILNIQLRLPMASGKPSEWSYMYLDDITAIVRERYDDKQSDEW
jgi:hypothetical protein